MAEQDNSRPSGHGRPSFLGRFRRERPSIGESDASASVPQQAARRESDNDSRLIPYASPALSSPSSPRENRVPESSPQLLSASAGGPLITLVPSIGPDADGHDSDSDFAIGTPNSSQERYSLSVYAFKTADNQYQYKKLPTAEHFRIMELQPGKKDDEIRFILHTVSWEQKPIYEAISYAWGDKGDLRNSSNEGRNFKITISLYEALQHFRRIDRPRYVWADAVCINQQDAEEVSHHVGSHMLRIFRESARTLIWLGVDDTKGHGALALATIDRIADQICINSRLARYEISGLFDPYETLRNLGPRILEPIADKLTPKEWKALRYLYRKPWFARLWVVQEFNHSKRPVVYCGLHSLDAHVVAFIAAWQAEVPASCRSKHNHSITHTHTKKAAAMRRPLFGDKGVFCLALHHGREYNVSEPKDRIYAILGMKTVATAWKHGANYSLTKDEVYRKVVDAVLRQEQKLRILSCVCHSTTDNSIRRPSWVPQWDRDAVDPLWWSLSQIGWKAAGDRPLELHWHRSDLFPNNIFKVRGLEVSAIKQCFKLPEKALGLQTRRTLDVAGQAARGAAWRELLIPRSQYPDELAKLGAYGQTFHCGLNEYGSRFTSDRDRAINLAAYLILACGAHAPIADDNLRRLGEARLQTVRRDEISFLGWNLGWAACRTFFVTESDHIGMAPDCVAEGDRVCLLYGADMPFILRPASSKQKDEYLLVGESYCHGLMEGEFVKDWDKGLLPNVREKDFKLA